MQRVTCGHLPLSQLTGVSRSPGSHKTGSDTGSTSTDESTGLNISGVVYSESDLEESPIVKHRKHFKNVYTTPSGQHLKNADQREEKLPDQALINQRILSQLDAIGKRLTVIENKSASPAKPKAKKSDKKGSVQLVQVSNVPL